MWAYFFFGLASSCIPFDCVDLGVNLCARKSFSTIMINTANSCESNLTCLTSDLQSMQNTSTEYLFCVDSVNETQYNWNSFTYECGVRATNRNFTGGSSIVQCTQDSDCALDDGSHTACECGADGLKYCIPAWDSPAFDEYWVQCETGLTHSQLEFWIMYKTFYPIWITATNLSCVTNTFYELNLMKNLSLSTFGYLFIVGMTVIIFA